jgi:2-polyprenyl-6-methoxyphenol hydroxylase-like FAD-dependent oxidoreductase
MPQKDFLAFITAEAARYSGFTLVMKARVEALVEDGGAICGVRYRGADGWHEVRAPLTVAADGRFSRVRRLAGFTPVSTSAPIDVLWFRVSRQPGDPGEALARVAEGHLFILLQRGDQWQVAGVIVKGTYQELRSRGIEELQRTFAAAMPELSDRAQELHGWRQVSLLSVESNRMRRWYRPGLLLIGDAAHTMSPVGGVGINYAIQDAVVAYNVLAAPLQMGEVTERQLARVQRAREWPVRVIQAWQSTMQDVVLGRVLRATGPVEMPRLVRLALRLPGIGRWPARLVGLGLWRVHVRERV